MSNMIHEKITVEEIDKIKSLFNKITKSSEFEFIFFSKSKKKLTFENYVNLLKFLAKRSQNNKFEFVTNDMMLDVIYNSNANSTYRCSINGKEAINKYMKQLSNAPIHVIFRNIAKLKNIDKNIHVIKKNKEAVNVVDIDDLYMRVRLSDEIEPSKSELEELIKLDNTHMSSIIFRFKERSSLYVYKEKNEYIKIDLTLIKSNNNYNKLHTSAPQYELEIELISENPKQNLLNIMFNETELLLKMIQQSNFYITKTSADNVIRAYKNLLSIGNNESFLYGRQSVSLEIQYVESLVNKYAVTDKADGERQLLIIVFNKVYFITKHLEVKDTGIIIKQKEYNNTILDGELLFIKGRHVFLVFDCLFANNIDVRKIVNLGERLKHADNVIEKCFIFGKQKGYKSMNEKFKNFNLDQQLSYHKKEIKNLFDNLNHDIEIDKRFVLVRRKYFIHSFGVKDWEIFAYSSLMYSTYLSDSSIKCPYIIDGLIYQPNDQAYITNMKESIYKDFKWKPSVKNSIDFYIEFVKDNNGNILTIYDNSYDDVTDNQDEPDIEGLVIKNKQYKICKLHVGKAIDKDEIPILFREKENLHEAYLMLADGTTDVRDIEGNILIDKTVVEFYYDLDSIKRGKFKWIPMRTRYDKTESVIKYKKQYGNYTSTADKVWQSINNPVLMTDFNDLSKGNDPNKNIYFYSKKMDSLKKKISHELIVSASRENKYFQVYNTLAKPMKSFHNFIKTTLITTYCGNLYQNKQLSILDFGCGKGEDLMRLYYAKIAFCVGIDFNQEALSSQIDGAISRYNKFKKSKANFPKVHFIRGDFTTELNYENQVKSLNGMDGINKTLMEKFFSSDSKKRTLFDVINCQFAIHYAFKDHETFTNLKKNINDYLRNDGYVIVTTFDAQRVIELIGEKDKYTQEYTDENGQVKVLYEIVKKYDIDKKSSIIGVGNAIDVHMAWIMQEGVHYTEYLVDEHYIVEQFKKDCDLDLVSTDTFDSQFNIHKNFMTDSILHESSSETKKNLYKFAEYYTDNAINRSCWKWTHLEKFYIFKKNMNEKSQKGGDFMSQFIIPDMNLYNDEYSFMNSIHHIMKKCKVIPQSITPNDFYKDIGIDFEKDIGVNNEKIRNVAKKIHIYHMDETTNKKEKIIDGLNIILIERDCNNDPDVTFIQKFKQINDNELVIIIMKDGDLYVPIYENNNSDNVRNGIFNIKNNMIHNLIEKFALV